WARLRASCDRRSKTRATTLTPTSEFDVEAGFAEGAGVALAGAEALSGAAALALSGSRAQLRVISLNDSTGCFIPSSQTSQSAAARAVTARLLCALTLLSSRTSPVTTAPF